MTLAETLVEDSSLTKRQLQALVNYMKATSGEFKLREAAEFMAQGRTKGAHDRPVSVGSFYRTVGQARGNVRDALVTVLISLWLGLVRVEDVRRLFEMVGAGARELSEEEQSRFVTLLKALLDRMVL